jgi:hypothetical protein
MGGVAGDLAPTAYGTIMWNNSYDRMENLACADHVGSLVVRQT